MGDPKMDRLFLLKILFFNERLGDTPSLGNPHIM